MATFTPLSGSGQTPFRGLPAQAFHSPLAAALARLGPQLANSIRANRQQAAASRLAEIMAGSGQQMPAGAPQPQVGTPTVARPGGAQTGTAGMLPQGSGQLAQALAGVPGGGQALAGLAAEQLRGPEQMTPFQQAQVGLQERQVEQGGRRLDIAERGQEQELALARQANRLELAKLEADLAEAGRKQFQNAGQLRAEWRKSSADFLSAKEAFDNITSIDPATADQAADVTLARSFVEMLPGDITATAGQPLPPEAEGIVPAGLVGVLNTALLGNVLQPGQRSAIRGASRQIMAGKLAAQETRNRTFTGLAQRGGFNPENVVLESVIGDLPERVDVNGGGAQAAMQPQAGAGAPAGGMQQSQAGAQAAGQGASAAPTMADVEHTAELKGMSVTEVLAEIARRAGMTVEQVRARMEGR